MDLGGAWRAATADDTLRRHFPDPDLADDDWESLDVPGHWRSSPAFAGSDGPLFYRRTFETPDDLWPTGDARHPGDGHPDDGRRAWLDLDGLFYQGDVWFDGSYLGDTEGYFVPHRFEVTQALAARREHTVAIEVTCAPPGDLSAKRNLTGVFQHWNCIDPAWNPGGIWAPVRVVHTGPVRIAGLQVLCPDARPERAVLHLEADLNAADATTVSVSTTVRRHASGQVLDVGPVLAERVADETLSGGRNRVRWRVTVEQPDLWWPHALGGQPLHDVVVRVDVAGRPSDERTVVTGLRQVRLRNFIATVNGERLFLKGANLGPVRRELAEATASDCAGDVALARQAGLDLLRLHGHIARPEVYEAADRAGLLIWQDLPLQWGYANVRREAVRQARAAVRLLGHHPSVAVWCGHNEPFAVTSPVGGAPAGRTFEGEPSRRLLTGQFLPGFNKTILDGSIRRALERADSSRPVVAHSGVLPHPGAGTDTHLYLGWLDGDERDLPSRLARLPILARFLGEFGAQAVPDTAEWMEPERWPDLDWERLGRAHGLAKEIFDRRVPPAEYPSFDSWRQATQRYQATVLRRHIETLRRLKYRPTGGFCQFMLADAQPSISASVLDHRRRAKLGFQALTDACAPVIVVADRPAVSYRPGDRVRLAVHAVSDLRVAVAGARATVVLAWPGGRRAWNFSGDLPADSCTRIGVIDLTLPDAASAPMQGSNDHLTIDLDLRYPTPTGPEQETSNHYDAALLPRGN